MRSEARKSWKVQCGVCIDHSHQGDPLEVQALGHHLGADENVGCAPSKGPEDISVRALALGGIAVHAQRAGVWKEALHGLLHLFRTDAEGAQPLAVALGAGGRHGPAEVAVVALQEALALVVGQRDIALGAAEGEAAVAAEQKG